MATFREQILVDHKNVLSNVDEFGEAMVVKPAAGGTFEVVGTWDPNDIDYSGSATSESEEYAGQASISADQLSAEGITELLRGDLIDVKGEDLLVVARVIPDKGIFYVKLSRLDVGEESEYRTREEF